MDQIEKELFIIMLISDYLSSNTIICILFLIWPILKTYVGQKYFRSIFGSNENFKICFWDYLTFRNQLLWPRRGSQYFHPEVKLSAKCQTKEVTTLTRLWQGKPFRTWVNLTQLKQGIGWADLIHPTYSWNIKCQKCSDMGLNGFIFEKIDEN